MGELTPKGSGGIVWLASYPKSGNTWLRALFSAYRAASTDAFHINRMGLGLSAASRRELDELLGVETADLPGQQVRGLLPHAFRAWALQPGGPHWVKTHDACDLIDGAPIFPSDATRVVLHVVRDPRDVVLSARHHWGLDIDATITRLNNPDQWVADGEAPSPQVPQHLSDWSGHARSWLQADLPRLTLRYEDMLKDPERSFSQALQACGLNVDVQRVRAAVEACHIDRLREQERAGGFRERFHASTAPFFGSGRAGGWRQVLSESQQMRITAMHGDMMRYFGYLD